MVVSLLKAPMKSPRETKKRKITAEVRDNGVGKNDPPQKKVVPTVKGVTSHQMIFLSRLPPITKGMDVRG